MKTLEKLYNIEDVGNEVVNKIKSFNIDDLLVDEYDHRYEIFLDTISSGSAGSYQLNEIAEFFGMEKLLRALDKRPEERTELQQNMVDFGWEDIERYADIIVSSLNKKVKIPEYSGYFYFGHLEADGAYGLFYTWAVDFV